MRRSHAPIAILLFLVSCGSTGSLETYALGPALFIETACPAADQILRADSGDPLPKLGQTERSRVEEIVRMDEAALLKAYRATEVVAIPRNGQVWDGPGNGVYTIVDVEDYQIRITLRADAPCPQSPASWNGVPMVFYRS